jgi:hypothetical protein
MKNINEVIDSFIIMELTGNPFVDTGLAVIAAKAGCASVDDLSLEQMQKVHGDGEWLARVNSAIKSTSMIFTINSLSTHPGIKPLETRIKYYAAVTKAILDSIGKEDLDHYCECCGNKKSLDIDELVRRTLVPLGYPDASRSIGRDWFPLAGSIASDAQALPAASRSPYLCAKCLFAVHYLPLGTILMNGRLAVFQSTSETFWYRYVSRIARDVYNRVSAGMKETLGAKRGSTAVIEEAFGAMEEMKNEVLEPGTALFVWRFSNSGTGPDCTIEEIPNRALEFLYEARGYGYQKQVLDLISHERRKDPQLIQAIQGGQDYPSLYPKGKYDGAPSKLFHLYQSRVRGVSTLKLQAAFNIAEYAGSHLEKKQFDKIAKELISNRASQNQVKRLIAEMVKQGKLSAMEYFQLFALPEAGATVSFDAWKFIQYYMRVGLFEKSHFEPPLPELKTDIEYYASAIFSDYIESRGIERFDRDVLSQLELGHISSGWLRRRFLDESLRRPGFTYTAWKGLTLSESGWDTTRELLYRMRLFWLEWIKLGKSPTYPVPVEIASIRTGTDLPAEVERELMKHLEDYVTEKGIKRFKQNIIDGIFRGDTDLYWFRGSLSPSVPELREEEGWERFLADYEGNPIRRLRLFQMQLITTNFYREKII